MSLLDLILPQVVEGSCSLACILVPHAYVATATAARLTYLLRMWHTGRLYQFPEQAAGQTSCPLTWLVFLSSPSLAKRLLKAASYALAPLAELQN